MLRGLCNHGSRGQGWFCNAGGGRERGFGEDQGPQLACEQGLGSGLHLSLTSSASLCVGRQRDTHVQRYGVLRHGELRYGVPGYEELRYGVPGHEELRHGVL